MMTMMMINKCQLKTWSCSKAWHDPHRSTVIGATGLPTSIGAFCSDWEKEGFKTWGHVDRSSQGNKHDWKLGTREWGVGNTGGTFHIHTFPGRKLWNFHSNSSNAKYQPGNTTEVTAFSVALVHRCLTVVWPNHCFSKALRSRRSVPGSLGACVYDGWSSSI